jgi:hypothetical protein
MVLHYFKMTCAFIALQSAAFILGPAAQAQDKSKQTSKIAGIVTEKKDNWIMLKADGEEEAVKYQLPDGAEKRMVEAFKGVFPSSRWEVKYVLKGDNRELTAFGRVVGAPTGVLTGEVLANHGWWIEVKAKDGSADGYAPMFVTKDSKGIEALIKGLKKGDVVLIKYHTDFERRRIDVLERYVAGIVVEKKDRTLLLKADGEEDAVNYALPGLAERRMVDAFRTIFDASRAEVRYRLNGDTRELTAFARLVGKKNGTVTGEVLASHGSWIEVKPKDAVADAYAPTLVGKDSKAIAATMKDLKKGDIVTIQYNTDSERRRIESLEKKE